MSAGEKIAPPHLIAGIGGLRGDDDERREIAVFRSQAIAHPRAEARPGEGKGAGVDAEGRLVVIGMVGLHRADHAQIIDTLAHPRKQLADLRSRLPMRGELPLRAFEKHLKGALPPLELRHRDCLPGIGDEPRLRIPRFDMRHPATHVEEDHPLGPGGEVGGTGGERIGRRGFRPARRGLTGEQLTQQPRHKDRPGRHRTDQATARKIGGTAHESLGLSGVSLDRVNSRSGLRSIQASVQRDRNRR